MANPDWLAAAWAATKALGPVFLGCAAVGTALATAIQARIACKNEIRFGSTSAQARKAAWADVKNGVLPGLKKRA